MSCPLLLWPGLSALHCVVQGYKYDLQQPERGASFLESGEHILHPCESRNVLLSVLAVYLKQRYEHETVE